MSPVIGRDQTLLEPDKLVLTVLVASLVLIALAIAKSLLVWREERDNRVLWLTGLLVAVGWRYGLLLWVIAFNAFVNHIAIWVQLASSLLGIMAAFGTGSLLRSQRLAELERNRMRGAIQEVSAQRAHSGDVDFFTQATDRITEILGVDYAFIGEFIDEDEPSIRTVGLSRKGQQQPSVTYALAGTPCDHVVGREPRYWPSHLQERFPDDEMLGELEVHSYLALPLSSTDDEPLGLLAVLHGEPMEGPEEMIPALRILAARAEDELERQRRDAELVASERRYRVVFEESQDALFISSMGGHLIDANPAAVDLFGYESRQQMLENFKAEGHYIDPSQRKAFIARLLEKGFVRDLETQVLRRDGNPITVVESATAERDAAGEIVAIRGTLRDVTERRKLEEQLVKSQRMEAVGRMAGGVAHDFNNVLTVIEGHSELLLDRFQDDESVASELRSVRDAAKRATAFTRRLLLLSRRKVLAPAELDVRQLVSELELLLTNAVGGHADLVLDLDPDTGWALADPSQLEQVLLNLVINAKDAMPDGGMITVTTRNVSLSDDRVASLGLLSRDCVEIAVEDQGVGIAPSELVNIFEPFFTTKDPSIGTGLGLSTVYSLLRQMRGGIEVESRPGLGSRFLCYLPARKPGEPQESNSEAKVADAGGSEMVLVVDDDRSVARLLHQFLERLGYGVLVANSGDEALAVLKVQPSVELMISDVMMPGMTGHQLADNARRAHPGLKILLVSGYAESARGRDQVMSEGVNVMSKPFTTAELAAEVRSLLDS